MGKARLEAFSDGVIAIIITIMVLELKAPRATTWHALLEPWPIFLSYVLSFAFVGIYWANHHHLIHTVKRVTPGVIWANLHLLFWLSLTPFATDWLGESRAAPVPTAVYALLMLISGMAYQILQSTIARQQTDAAGKTAHARSSRKGLISTICYAAALAFSFFVPLISIGLFIAVAVMWMVPERSFEKVGVKEG